jgi:hypothetical protein
MDERVGQEIEHDLLQPRGIAIDQEECRTVLHVEFERAPRSVQPRRRYRLGYHRCQVRRRTLDVELAGLQ